MAQLQLEISVIVLIRLAQHLSGKRPVAKPEESHNEGKGPAKTVHSPNRSSPIFWGLVCSALTLLVVWAVYAFTNAGPRLPAIDQQKLDEARATWKQHGPANYDITVNVRGTRAAIYHVEVRDGEAIRATRDGDPLTDDRTLGTWSVPGMFDTMQSDVDHIDEPIQVNAREAHHVTPCAIFDPACGYPSHYRRIEWGSSVEVGWEVTEFAIVPTTASRDSSATH